MDIAKITMGFINRLHLMERSGKTIDGYRPAIEKYLAYFNRDPKTITVEEAIIYLNTLEVYARKTAIAALKFLYGQCLNSNKFANLPYPKLPKKETEVPSEKEVKRLIEVTKNIKHQTIIMLFYTTGMRPMEIINLKWPNVDRSNMVIWVKEGKSKKDRRVILTPSMMKQFTLYCKHYKLSCFNGQEYVFKGESKTKESYSDRSIASFLYKYRALAGISKKITPRILRHAYATHQREAGTDTMDIKESMGHESLKTTETYAGRGSLKRMKDLMG